MNVFTDGIGGVPAPFVIGGLYMLVSGLILQMLGVGGMWFLIGSFGVGAVMVVGGFLIGLLKQRAQDKEKASEDVDYEV